MLSQIQLLEKIRKTKRMVYYLEHLIMDRLEKLNSKRKEALLSYQHFKKHGYYHYAYDSFMFAQYCIAKINSDMFVNYCREGIVFWTQYLAKLENMLFSVYGGK